MQDYSTITAKLQALKILIEKDSITPLSLGVLLDEIVSLIAGAENSSVNEAQILIEKESEARDKSEASIRQSIVSEASTRAAGDGRLETKYSSRLDNLGTEASQRANADNELRASLALLKNTVNINEENLNDLEDKYKDLRTEIVYLVMRLDGITDGIPDHVGAAASRRYYFDRESKQFYFTDDYQVDIFNHGLQRLFLVGDDLYIFIDNDLRLIHAAPTDELKAAIDAKPDFDDLSNVYGEPTSEESDDEFEARTGFTREDMKKDLFDDMWKAAVGPYGTVDHTHVENNIKKPYYLNELWLTYEEAVICLQAYLNRPLTQSDAYMNYTGRTQIPTRVYGPIRLESVLRGSYVTHARLTQAKALFLYAGSLGEYMFSTASVVAASIKKWLDVVVLFGSGNPALESSITCFINAPKLEYFRIQNVNKDVYLNQSSNIGIDSLQYLIANRYPLTSSNAKAFSIIVHPDVYAKLIDETNTEWHQLLLDAAEKQIQFATA